MAAWGHCGRFVFMVVRTLLLLASTVAFGCGNTTSNADPTDPSPDAGDASPDAGGASSDPGRLRGESGVITS